MATKVLMVLAVGSNASWKLPVAYCLTDGTQAVLQNVLINSIISELYRCGCFVISVTMDGLPANLKTINKLGGKAKPHLMDSTFPHCILNDSSVAAVLDAAHMIKLARNTFAEYKEIYIPSMGLAKWHHIEMLYNEQKTQQLTLANKLTKGHIQFKNQKMRVRLAVQVFSASCAKAIRFLRESGHVNFQDSEPTENFLLTMNELFDYLNIRSPFGKGTKHPFNEKNIDARHEFLRQTKDYLLNLEDNTGKLLLHTKRKTFIIGLVITIDSVIYLTRILIKGPGLNGIMLKYFLTYKMSQDNIETVFATVRKRGGYSNNPTPLQFRSTYKSILNHIGVVGMGQENIMIDDENNSIELESPFDNDVSDNAYDTQLPKLSEYVENVCTYITGFIIRKLTPKIKCEECREVLVDVDKDPEPNTYFLRLRNNGGLVFPSKYAVHVVEMAERQWRMLIKPGESLETKHTQQFEIAVFKTIKFEKLPYIQTHLANTIDGIDSHIHTLTRLLIGQYITIRTFHVIKQFNCEQGTNIRQKFTKIIHFKNQ